MSKKETQNMTCTHTVFGLTSIDGQIVFKTNSYLKYKGKCW